MDDSFDVSKYKKRFPFPANLDIEVCNESTEIFARFRLHYLVFKESEEGYDPFLEKYVKSYPLPADFDSIFYWITDNGFDEAKYQERIKPIIQTPDNYIGLVKRCKSEKAVGWFLGLVKPFDYFHMSENERDQISTKDHSYLLRNMHYSFIEGIVLFEGGLDENVFRQLKDYEKEYNKYVLGKVITGRPRSDPEYWLEPARAKIQEKPDITQDDLAYEIGCDLKTFKINRKNGGFATYKEFKDSILKP